MACAGARPRDDVSPPGAMHSGPVLAAIRSAAVVGIDAYDVTVEVDATSGLPQWTLVGLAAGAVREARERVSAAVLNSGFALPPRRFTVNLAPADTRKEGTAFDLPIALGVLVATGQLDARATGRIVALGELGLDGSLRPVRGVLPVARRLADCSAGNENGNGRPITLLLPPANAAEASLVSRLDVRAPETLADLVTALRRGELDALPAPAARMTTDTTSPPDLHDVVGQGGARRALEVAAAGAHALLMIGPPGSGKTMLARRLPGILPPLSEEEALEVVSIRSVAGELTAGGAVPRDRPFRAPHHTLSAAALVGGGRLPRPGEASLAHHGVLFLDELQEIPRHVLDALRQPMEDGIVTVARATAVIRFPARFSLVGAMNPCPCGHAGDPRALCRCSATDIERHAARLSGPLADRIDMHVHLAPVPLREFGRLDGGEPSHIVRERVERARAVQAARYARVPGVRCNAHAPGRWIDRCTPVDRDAQELLVQAEQRYALTARAYHRVLKVARTIADLDGDETVRAGHVAEGLRYRPAQVGVDPPRAIALDH